MVSDPIKVLVVDDEELSRELLRRLISAAGYHVVEASNGADALDVLRAERPDLAITDILMPVMDGYDFVRELRSDAEFAATPVIIFTGAYRREQVESVAKLGGVLQVLVRPATPQEILSAIESALAAAGTSKPASFAVEEYEREHKRVLLDKVSEQERRLRALFDNALDAIFFADNNGRCVDANPAGCNLLGYTHDELLRLTVWDLTPASHREAVHEAWRKFIAGARQSGECEVVCKDASTRFVEYRAVANILPDTHMAVMQDITERKQAENTLRESEQQLMAFMDYMPGFAWMKDINRRYLYLNKYWNELMFNDSCDWFGRTDEQLWPDDIAAPLVANDERALATRAQVQTLETYSKGDKTVFCLVSKFPVFDDEGRVLLICGVGVDITERKRAEEALHNLSGRLLQVQDEEHRRIARELHDSTAQALAAVCMNLGQLGMWISGRDAKAEKLLADSIDIINQCGREIRTISHLLHPPLLETFGLAKTLRQYIDGFAQRSGISVRYDASYDMERLADEIETALFRVVQESLGNIHRHAHTATASVTLSRTREGVELKIEDDGVGLNKPISTDDEIVSLGIGIAGMSGRLKQLGGHLKIEERSPGTVVKAFIPLDET